MNKVKKRIKRNQSYTHKTGKYRLARLSKLNIGFEWREKVGNEMVQAIGEIANAYARHFEKEFLQG